MSNGQVGLVGQVGQVGLVGRVGQLEQVREERQHKGKHTAHKEHKGRDLRALCGSRSIHILCNRTWSDLMAVAVLCFGTAVLAQSPKYHVGRTPTDEDTRALGIMVAPDGKGLPAGSGTAVEGKVIFAARCAPCHGAKGEGGDGPALVGGKGTLATPTPKRTVGSYWPYATTVWDYVNRAMPFNQPGTLRPDEVYAVAAYVLFLNDIVGETQVMDARSLPLVKMPNRDGFVSDPRPDVPGQRPQ